MSREEAAAKGAYVGYNVDSPDFDAAAAWDDMNGTDDWEQEPWGAAAQAALAAADAHDAAHGIHRVSLDDATVERAVEVLLEATPIWCLCKSSPFDKHDVNPPCSMRLWARGTVRAVLAAAVEAGQ